MSHFKDPAKSYSKSNVQNTSEACFERKTTTHHPSHNAQIPAEDSTLEYMVDMTEQLRLLAHKSDLIFLAYLFEMAKDEALSELDKDKSS